MNSPAHDIAAYLADQGVGALLGASQWAINFNGEQASPADTITVYDTGGGSPDTDELDIDQVAFQVRVRATNATDGWVKHRQVRDFLIFSQPLVCDTSVFSLIVQVSDFGTIGTDQSGRHIMTANYIGRRSEREAT